MNMRKFYWHATDALFSSVGALVIAAAILVAIVAFTARSHAAEGGSVYENNANSVNSTQDIVILRDREVSAANTALTVVYDIGDLSQVLAITAACNAGTATLTVSVSSDDTNFLTIDSLTAAATNTKQYNNSSTGATLALSPLAFRWVKVVVGACGATDIATLTVAGK